MLGSKLVVQNTRASEAVAENHERDSSIRQGTPVLLRKMGFLRLRRS